MRIGPAGFIGFSAVFTWLSASALASHNVVAEGAASPSKSIVFVSGQRIPVADATVRDGLVVFTTLEGRRHSVSVTFVDWTASEGVSRPLGIASRAETADHAPPRVVSLGCLGSSALAPRSPVPLASGASVSSLEPPPPEPPAVIARDDQGNVTLRATRLNEPLTLDGRLEEPVYRQVPSMAGFLQQEPHEGEPATERTEVWVFYDSENVYVSSRLWDSHPERMVVSEMRRDNRGIGDNENFAVILDTFHDRRNGFVFTTNPLGALWDGQVTDENNLNGDWNTVWHVKTSRFSEGWAVEIAIPFKSLRYKAGTSQIWGVNFRRIVKWKNERSYLTPIAAAYRRQGLWKLSSAATIFGIEPPSSSMNLEVKPYATSELRTDREADPVVSNDFNGDGGFDVKYGLTQGLIADFTYNTDFAQVEEDDQQVNLTRFSLFFPEKRDFFLEGQGIFAFGGVNGRGGGGGGDTPIMFFSRRIGLTDEEAVPINAGGRITGRAGEYSLGMLAIQTDEVASAGIPTTSFSVARLKRDVFRRSNIGFLATHRSESVEADGANTLFGVDANFSFFENLDLNAYYAVTDTQGLDEDDVSYFGKMDYGGDRYGLRLEHLVVGEGFHPEVGFVRREDIRKSTVGGRFSPRPTSLDAVRQFDFQGRLDYIEDLNDARLESRNAELEFRTEFNSSDMLRFTYTRTFEYLDEEFEVADAIFLPIGAYDFQEAEAAYFLGRQRPVSGWLEFTKGSFYNGSRNAARWSGRVDLGEQFTLEPTLSFNWVKLPEGDFTTKLVRLRANYTFTPRIFLGALVQFNSSNDALSTNVRFRWEYQPGSDLYVVYNDGRDTTRGGFPTLQTRSLIVKLTRLFRF